MTSNTPPPDPLYNEIVSTTQRLFQVQPYEWKIQIFQDLVLSHRSWLYLCMAFQSAHC